MQRNSKPIAWRMKGLSDALDASDAMSFPGSMLSLQNLIPDPSTRDLWQCRPAAVKLIDFNTTAGAGPFSSGFSSGFQHSYFPGTAGFISCMKVVGNFVYGMMADAAIPGGYDAPFCYNLATGAAVLVTGTQTPTTLPLSPPTTNAWVPPQMDVIGTMLMVAHNGFTGAGGNFIGWFDISTPGSPVWHAGNMGGLIQFTVAPIAVKQFNNRAYYIHNASQPAVIFSDALNALNATNANQILTFNDNVTLTALGALPLNNLLGGIIQSIMVFKGVSNIFQITGDAASTTNPVTVNALDVATGTLAPNTVVPCSMGLAFVAPDGLRIISFSGQVSEPLGHAGSGITVPFIYATVPSRMVACANGNNIRLSVQNGNIGSTPTLEYWYNFSRKIWHGPHTFPASLMQPWNGTFIMTPTGITASLWQSDPVQSITSSFTENGTALAWTAQTTLLPDTDLLTNNCMTETSLDMALPPTSASVTVVAADQNGTVIDTAIIVPPSAGSSTIWGSFTWAGATWGGGAATALSPYQVAWKIPIVFSRMTVQATGRSVLGFKIGTWHLRYQVLRQLVNTAAAA